MIDLTSTGSSFLAPSHTNLDLSHSTPRRHQKSMSDLTGGVGELSSSHHNPKLKKRSQTSSYLHYLKDFYAILSCHTNHQGQQNQPKLGVTRSRSSMASNSFSYSISSGSVHSLHDTNFLKSLTYERLKPIELIAEDFDHDDYIDLSFIDKDEEDEKVVKKSSATTSSINSNSVAGLNSSQSGVTHKLNFKSCFTRSNKREVSKKGVVGSENNESDQIKKETNTQQAGWLLDVF